MFLSILSTLSVRPFILIMLQPKKLNVMKFKTTTVSTDDKELLVTVTVNDSDSPVVVSVTTYRFPFNLVPPQIAHQVASQLVMCNSYYVEPKEDEKVSSSSE